MKTTILLLCMNFCTYIFFILKSSENSSFPVIIICQHPATSPKGITGKGKVTPTSCILVSMNDPERTLLVRRGRGMEAAGTARGLRWS